MSNRPIIGATVGTPMNPDKFGGAVTANSIRNALGYTPADAAVVGEKLDTLFAVEWMATKTESDAPEKVIFPEQSTTYFLESLQEAIQPGYEYDVTVNGAKYTCTAGEHSDGVYIGNAALAGDDDKPHNNEPFCILWYGGSATGAMFYKDSTLAFPVTVKVTDHSEVVYNKLPKEFLPDGIGGGGGMSATAINLLIEVLESAVYNANVSGKIASLKEALIAGGSGGGDMPDNPVEPDEPVVPDDITVSGGVMTIISVGSEIAVSDGVMTIA